MYISEEYAQTFIQICKLELLKHKHQKQFLKLYKVELAFLWNLNPQSNFNWTLFIYLDSILKEKHSHM